MAKTRIIKCAECGVEFETAARNQKYCSPECGRKAERDAKHRACRTACGKEEHDIAIALKVSAPVPLETIMRARRKPDGVSAVRWRIELLRRAMADYYALFGQ